MKTNIKCQSSIPIYKTKSEVLKSEYENKDFFDSYSDSLRNSWKFYSKLNN